VSSETKSPKASISRENVALTAGPSAAREEALKVQTPARHPLVSSASVHIAGLEIAYASASRTQNDWPYTKADVKVTLNASTDIFVVEFNTRREGWTWKICAVGDTWLDKTGRKSMPFAAKKNSTLPTRNCDVSIVNDTESNVIADGAVFTDMLFRSP
jgi:hypothetical protein